MLKHISIWVISAFLLLQLIQIDIPKTPDTIDSKKEIDTPAPIASLLKTSCYDCHSYQTQIPWYGHVAPFSFEVKSHIKNGRLAVNFQEWGNYDEEKQQKIYKGIIKTIEVKMPLPIYLKAHEEAKLTDAQRNQIKTWAQSHKKEEL